MILIFFSPLQSKASFTFEFITTCEYFQIDRFLIKHSIIDHNFRQIQLQIQRQIENYKDKDKFKMPQTPIYFFAKEVTLGY